MATASGTEPFQSNIDSQEIGRDIFEETDFGTGFLLSDTQMNSKKLFEELSQIFCDCDVNCANCVKFISGLKQHIRDAHSQQTKTDETGDIDVTEEDTIYQTMNGIRDPTFETVSIKVELIEQSRQLNISDPEIVDDEDGEELTRNVPVQMDEDNEETLTDSEEQEQTLSQTVVDNELTTTRNVPVGMDEETLTDSEEQPIPETLDRVYYTCRLCLKKFKEQESLDSHFLNQHTNTNTSKLKYVCVLCGERFMNKTKLNTHVITKHPKEKGKLVPTCQVCGQSFTKIRALERHTQRLTVKDRLGQPWRDKNVTCAGTSIVVINVN